MIWGRIVIPKEIRRKQEIKEGDPIEIFMAEGGVIGLRKYDAYEEVAQHLKNALDALDYDDPLYEEISKIKKKVEKNS